MHGEREGRRHVVSTAIEHKAALEPLEALSARGLRAVNASGIERAVRADTLLVSVMHVNNEAGVRRPVAEIAGFLAGCACYYFHIDAAQVFGKETR